MHSYTSSSDDRLPAGDWIRALVYALLVLMLFVGAMELRLAARGYRTTVLDSEALWLKQRQRASDLGDGAIILVGASRIQLDLDLDVLRRVTGLEPVQLAIDGSPGLPILEGLARDAAVRGTVLVDYDPFSRGLSAGSNRASFQYQLDYEKHRNRIFDASQIENWLADKLHTSLRSYSDGSSPLNSLRSRILTRNATPQYLITLPDRSRLADYRRVSMPAFYYGRVMRNLGQEFQLAPDATFDDLDRELKRRIAALAPNDNAVFLQEIQRLRLLAKQIQDRGGRVVFIRLPESGYVREMDERRYPRALFWDHFAAGIGAPTLNFADVAGLKEFNCPDGSHLDYRDRARFTRALLAALDMKASGTGGE